VKLTVAGTLTVNGSVTANGGVAPLYAGGSGGSIYVTAGTFAGSGSFAANGAVAPYTGGSMGGGGGGRIAVHYTSKTFTGTLTAFGGTSAGGGNHGAAGTVFQKAASQTNGELLVDNNNVDAGVVCTTSIPASAAWTLDTVDLRRKGNLEASSGTTLAVSSVTGNNTGGTLTTRGTLQLAGSTTLTVSNVTWAGDRGERGFDPLGQYGGKGLLDGPDDLRELDG